MKNSLLFTGLLLAASALAAPVDAPDSSGVSVVSRHHAVFEAPPAKFPSNCSTDAPLLGNGNLLATFGGTADKLRFHLSKADLWDLRPGGGPRRLAVIDLATPALAGASWRAEQDLARATTTAVFTKAGVTLRAETFVCATANTLVVELSAEGGSVATTVRLLGGDEKPAAIRDGLAFTERVFEKNKEHPTGAACVMRVEGDAAGGVLTVAPGKPVRLVVGAAGMADSPDFRAEATRLAKSSDLPALRRVHEAWWTDFWKKSFIEIPDKVLESRYYLSHYAMGSASRLAHFPPGLFPWVTTPAGQLWNGAYFNNYNLFAPFYGLYAANHIAQAMPCNDTVIDALELGRAFRAKECGPGPGIMLPTNMAPFGVVTRARTSHGQKSNASYACVALGDTWRMTRDLDFAKRAYPFVRETVAFWESHLVLEGGRYVDKSDATLEDSGNDLNPIHTLALIRRVTDLATDMSEALGVDADKRAKWTDIRDRLSDYPTCTLGDLPKNSVIAVPRTPENNALPIFRYSEQGTAWQRENAVGIQHIFPGDGIGLGVRPELLPRARNQITVLGRWIDFNGCNSFYPAAVRVGYAPDEILKHLRHWVDTASPNGMRADNPHGSEQFSIVPTTLQEMLLQSFDGTLRLFPNWPKDKDARFGTLRARDAFLVSAELKSGVVSGVTILSEKGRDCVVVNPWPGKSVKISRNGAAAETVSGERFTLKTKENETLALNPQ